MNANVEFDEIRPYHDEELPQVYEVVCPNNDDFEFLTQTLNVPESFLNDIADTDERPRTDTEGNWLLTILRIPVQIAQNSTLPFSTVPIGIITNNEIIVSVCYHNTDLLPDFIEHTRRKGITSFCAYSSFRLRRTQSPV